MTVPPAPRGVTQYSGILVVASPSVFGETMERLARLPGLEVHQTDPASGRAIVVQEAAMDSDPQALHRRILAVDGVVSAELVLHVVDPEARDQENQGD